MALVMVVDDDAAMRTLAIEMLSFFGHEAMPFENGLKAQEYLQVAGRRMPELILSDVMMPGLDGEHLCALLRAEPDTRDIPVLLMSAKAALRKAAEMQAGQGSNVAGFLAKPFQLTALKEAVALALQRPK